jgi:hypothetical protein
MTRDEILKMEAGVKINQLIWWKVFDMNPTPPNNDMLMLPNYSTRIAAAWEVVEKMKSNGWDFFMENAWRNRISKNVWWCMFENDDCEMEFCSEDITAQLAICKAALLAVMK